MNIRGGQLQQTNLNPVWPGSRFTGPLLAGNILRSGGPNLAGLGTQDQNSLGNVGYAKMIQAGRVTQAASPGSPAGVFASPDLIIPAQSLITAIHTLVLVAFTGAASTFGIGNSVNPIAFTPAGAVTAPASTTIATAVAPQLQNWLNCGPIDEQLVFTSSNTGAGVMLVLVEYMQGVNAPTS